MSNGIVHGGRLDEAIARHGGIKSRWLDLSTGINPATYPVPDMATSVWHDLPDDNALNDAKQAVRQFYGASDKAAISLASGSQAHIQLLPYLFKPQDVAIVGFTYQEHGVCWARAGHSVFVSDGLDSAEATARIIIVVNPNNPDGRIVDPDDLNNLSRRLGVKGGLLVVDESFGDVAPNASMVRHCGLDGLLVMRSIGKFFGLGGVRFGAALSHDGLVEKLDERLGPWAVSGPSLHAASAAFGDRRWQTRMRKKLSTWREELEELLLAEGVGVIGGTDLFVLAEHDEAQKLAFHLETQHILVRRFPAKPTWLRFGLPSTKAGMKKLKVALQGFETSQEPIQA